MIKHPLIILKSYVRPILVMLIFLMTTTCERDDICPEEVPTTPRLILEFFDVSNQENLKNVPSFFAQGVGNDFALPGFVGGSAINKVELPLKTDESSTSYRFVRDYQINDNGTPDDTSDDFATGNEDIITISYNLENEYVSRACGFKTVYRNVLVTVDDTDTDRWIFLVESVDDNQSIEDETTTHFKFFH